jgi:DNA-binding transcriptional ArsR family regulator
MKDGIDWAAIEQARKSLVEKPEVPDGWVTAQMYAKQHGVIHTTASSTLKRMTDAGIMERKLLGREFAYRLAKPKKA